MKGVLHVQPASRLAVAQGNRYQPAREWPTLRFDPGGREPDGYELGAEFQPIAKVQRLPLLRSERVFLTAATAHPS
jgi:hypothetical protein